MNTRPILCIKMPTCQSLGKFLMKNLEKFYGGKLNYTELGNNLQVLAVIKGCEQNSMVLNHCIIYKKHVNNLNNFVI